MYLTFIIVNLDENSEIHCLNIISRINLQFKGHVAAKMFEFVDIVCENYNTFEKFNVDQYMSSMGLSVDQKYRGRGIGINFLKSRSAIHKFDTNSSFFCHLQQLLLVLFL